MPQTPPASRIAARALDLLGSDDLTPLVTHFVRVHLS
jgi:hypothetical protein